MSMNIFKNKILLQWTIAILNFQLFVETNGSDRYKLGSLKLKLYLRFLSNVSRSVEQDSFEQNLKFLFILLPQLLTFIHCIDSFVSCFLK